MNLGGVILPLERAAESLGPQVKEDKTKYVIVERNPDEEKVPGF